MVLGRGQGTWAWDLAEKKYLDFTTGIGVNSLGHCHPEITETIARQAATLCHTSNLFYHQPYIELCEKLTSLCFGERVYLANSGTEAVETALKVARRYFAQRQTTKSTPPRHELVAAGGGFHGRTLGALSLSANERYLEGFSPLLPGVTHVPFGDSAALAKAVGTDTAAVILEPIQGNSGVIPARPDYFADARTICDDAGCLLIVDEIQTGVGRCGSWFAYQRLGVTPDIMTLAKALGGGLPLGAMITSDDIGQALDAGSHGSTCGGNPVACAAGLTLIEVIERDNLLHNVESRAAQFNEGIKQLRERVNWLGEVRGDGLMIGIVVKPPSTPRAIQATLRDHGLLVTLAGSDAIRLMPPLNVSSNEIEQALAVIARLGAESGTRPKTRVAE